MARVKGRVDAASTSIAAAGTRSERHGEALPTRSMARTSTVPPGRAGRDHGGSPTARGRDSGERAWMVRSPDSRSPATARIATGTRRREVPATARPPGAQTRTGCVWRARARPSGRRRPIEVHLVHAVEPGQGVAAGRQEAREHLPGPVGARVVEPPGDAGPPGAPRTAPAKSAAFASSARTAPGGPRTSTDTSGRAVNGAPPAMSIAASSSSGSPGPTSTLPRAVPVAPEASVTTRTTW